MAQITRVLQKLFASTATAGQLSKYGSLAAGSPVTYSGATVDPLVLQSLSNFLSGIDGGLLGSNSPAKEDINSLFYLAFRQIAYVLQQGIPEWDSTTDYYIDQFVASGGFLFKSLANSNTGNAVTDSTKWVPFASGIASNGVVTVVTGTRAITSADDGKVILIDSTSAAFNLTLPVVATMKNRKITIKDSTGMLSTNAVTIVRNASETIEFYAGDYALISDYGTWNLFCDGTKYFFI